MGYIDQSYMATPSSDPGVYKYLHLGTAAGTTLVQSQPCLIGYLQLNNIALGTIVAFDAAAAAGTTANNVIGSVAITSVSGSAPSATPLFAHLATKAGLVITYTGNLDLTIASLP